MDIQWVKKSLNIYDIVNRRIYAPRGVIESNELTPNVLCGVQVTV